MLLSLHIENVAVIEKLDVDFSSGFNVLTGETGAGKSIVIDSINAVLGKRTSKDIVRSGCEKAHISAVFSNDASDSSFASACEELGVDASEDVIIFSRDISADGRSSARINGRPVPAATLREIGNCMLTIHGQNDSRFLLDPSVHVFYLDGFANTEDVLDDYRKAYENVKNIRKKISALDIDEKEKSARIDLLRYQTEEIDGAELKEGEDTELFERKRILNNSEKTVSALNTALEYLRDGDANASDSFDSVCGALRKISGFTSEISELEEQAADISSAIDDLAIRIRSMLDDFDFSEAAINSVEDRLSVIQELKRKYGPEIEDVIRYSEKAKEELEHITFSEKALELLNEELSVAEESMLDKAKKLSRKRKEAASDLEKRIVDELAYLDMPKVRFSVCFIPCQPSLNGTESVEFMISPNVGEELKPLSKIASGGELSRIMLSIETVLNKNGNISTMIFDEIDTGVGGRAAKKLGIKMHEISKEKQVISITHLAQIAVCADTHLYVEKQNNGSRTFTVIKELDEESRVNEIARMLGGNESGDSVFITAKEMLSEYKV